ncbi:hypothetical protein JS756_05260 [Streptomyces actuosus]|uniref:Uncharacterized protein n=2 Tax=Streptomyces actuosus TaxID=1885 RepID=A0ABS2VKA4_STRAS|nr:hypothetical protein [Streptomyces actuosus]
MPYWDYAHDHARPDWVWQPSGVNRPTPGVKPNGKPTAALPTQSIIDGLLQRPTSIHLRKGDGGQRQGRWSGNDRPQQRARLVPGHPGQPDGEDRRRSDGGRARRL